MADTLLLDTVRWDLVLDVHGNIAVATDPYSVSQDVASAIRTFLGEVYYDTTLGIPYWTSILGKIPPVALMKTQFVAAAMTVPGVASAVCYLDSLSGRELTGQIQVTDTNGITTTISLNGLSTLLSDYAITDTGQIGLADTGGAILTG